jgi:hypothetical protein
MGRMEIGHGSEYQLLRFLGHHREKLESIILRNAYELKWLDYPKDKNSESLDGEYEGINFLPPDLQEKIKANWKAYWPQTGTPPNWDAVLYSKREDEWILVEAKAHLKELESSCGASDGSRKIIESAFEATRDRFGIHTSKSWLEPYYQLANRLAFVHFLLENKIKASLLYIYFLNGWPNDPNMNVTSPKAWRGAIDIEYAYLGINDKAKEYISEIFVEC